MRVGTERDQFRGLSGYSVPSVFMTRDPGLPGTLAALADTPHGLMGTEALFKQVLNRLGLVIWRKIDTEPVPRRRIMRKDVASHRRSAIRGRLKELGEAVSEHAAGKRLLILSLFDEYKKRSNSGIALYTQEIQGIDLSRELNDSSCDNRDAYLGIVDEKMVRLPGIYASAITGTFSRFPKIADRVHGCMNGVITSLLQDCRSAIMTSVETELGRLSEFSFKLVHEFECPAGQCHSCCPMEAFRDAIVLGLSAHIPATLVKTIELVQLNVSEGIEKQVSTLDDILELLTEGPAWIAERSNLINEMRVLQRAHNLLA
jgi:hypothetical protein